MMEDKKQDVNPLEELVKTVDSYRAFFANLANELSKVLADVKAPDEEEDTWEMKCPYEYRDKHYCVQSSGDVFEDCWHGIEADNSYFSQGNIFQTEEAAELEVKRRNLLTRFRAFRDECNGDWKINWNKNEAKYYLYKSNMTDDILCNDIYFYETFSLFGYFKNEEDAKRAIELFGDEIKELFVDCEV